MSKTVTITQEEYQRLLDVDAHMDELDARGVDNWGGYTGRYQYCNECDHDDISWTEEDCPKCGESLSDDDY